MACAGSPFRDFEPYLRIVVGLDEDDFQLILKQYKEKIVNSELSPGFYSVKDIANIVYTKGDHGRILKIE